VNRVELLDGNPMLANVAIAAVKQWQYKPLLANGKPVINFVVVVSIREGREGPLASESPRIAACWKSGTPDRRASESESVRKGKGPTSVGPLVPQPLLALATEDRP
jgi:hypothetical protein